MKSFRFLLFGLLARLIACDSSVTIVYRVDSRTPAQVQVSGFQSKAASSRETPDYSIYNHISVNPMGTQTNDGYIATTGEESVALQWLNTFFKGNAYLYTISATSNFINVDLTLGKYNPFPDEMEFVAKDKILWAQVMTSTPYTNNKPGTAVPNNNFDTSIRNEVAGGAEYQLAGFPPGSAAWKEAPWSQYAPKQTELAPSEGSASLQALGSSGSSFGKITPPSKPQSGAGGLSLGFSSLNKGSGPPSNQKRSDNKYSLNYRKRGYRMRN
jgi:cholera enterotoxin subunit A